MDGGPALLETVEDSEKGFALMNEIDGDELSDETLE